MSLAPREFVALLKSEGITSDDKIEQLYKALQTPLEKRIDSMKMETAAFYRMYLPHCIIVQLLREFERQFKATASSTSAPVSLLDRHYLIVDGELAHVSDRLTEIVEVLLMRRIADFGFTWKDEAYRLTVHFEEVSQGLPSIYAVRARDNKRFRVQRREDHRTHAHILKHFPQTPGVCPERSVVEIWDKKWSEHDGPNQIFAVVGCALLERVASSWLRRTPRVPSKSTMYVNKADAKQLVDILYASPHSRCHFMCIGQTSIRAYICVREANAQTELFRMHVGIVG